jgi:dihydropyrimidinase
MKKHSRHPSADALSPDEQITRREALKVMGATWIGAAAVGGSRAPWTPDASGQEARELLVRGGRVVNADGAFSADVRVVGETIVEIGPGLIPAPGAQVVDATGKLLIPGGIDPHTHILPPFADDITTGTMAAVAGGITTVGTFANPRDDEWMLDTLDRLEEEIGRMAVADVILHAGTWPPTPEYAALMHPLAERGQPSLKIYMVRRDFPERVPDVIRLLEAARDAGVVTMIHCEDQRLIDAASRRLAAQGKTSLRYYGESRPVVSEVAATELAVSLCESTGAPMQVVHLSSARALEVCAKGRDRGLPLYVEARPMYLHLTEKRMDGPDGPLFVGQPPLRTAQDAEALWRGLSNGSIDLLATDHAPWTREQKLDPELSITRFRPGVSSLRFMIPIYYSEGVVKGRISVERFVETTSTRAAQIMGLYPQKGVVRKGSLADLVILDPELTDTVRASDDPSGSNYVLYEGWEVTGWPVVTIRRGKVVYENGSVTAAPGSAKLVPRKPWRPE